MGLRDPDVGRAVEEALDRGDGLGPRERRAGAGVDAVPEREVLAAVRAVEAELGRALELARVAARGVGHHEHRGAGREVDAADGGGHPRQPERALHRRLGAQHLLDERADEVVVVAQPLLELGVVAEGPQAHA